MEWYEKYGWDESPFSIRPNKELVELEREKKEAEGFIKSGHITLITGPTGSGKSSFLMWLDAELKKNRFVPIKINCVEKYSRNDIFKEIKRHRKLKDRIIFKKYPQNTVLLLDETQCLLKDSAEFIKILWDEKKIHSIVLASIEKELDNLTGSFRDRVVGQTITIKKLTTAGAVQLIEKRTGTKNPFNSDAMIAIAEASDNIPRRVLESSRNICKRCAEENIMEINRLHVYQFLTPSETVEGGGEPGKTKGLSTTPIIETKRPTITATLRHSRLSPFQMKIVDILVAKNSTAEEIATLIGSTRGSVSKQLSRLRNKEIVVPTSNTRPTKYGLTDEQKRGMVKE